MLTITRRVGETIHVFPGEDLDPNMTVGELFGDREIVIRIGPVSGSRVRLSVTAPRQLKIWRGDGSADCNPEQTGHAMTPAPQGLRRA